MKRKNRASEEGGFVLVVVAMVLVLLLAFVALGVDTGILYSARTTAQEAGDAGALAAAYTFIVDPTAPQPATAIAAAKAVASTYIIFGNPVLPADVDVTVPVIADQKVFVDVRATRTTYFAKALGIMNANILTHSVAEAGLYAGPPPWPKPFFLPNTVASPSDPCTVACPGNQILIDPGTRRPTAYAQGLLAAPALPLSIKPVDPSDALQPSIFYLVDFNGGGGGAAQLNGWIDETLPVPPVACGSMLEVEKGNKVGLKKGIDDLLGNPVNDSFVNRGDYLINGTTHSDTSKALVTVPIWDTCGSGFCTTGIPKVGGHQQIQVLGFAMMFLEGMTSQHDPLVGRLINVIGCATTPTSTGSTVVGGFPLRLVRQ